MGDLDVQGLSEQALKLRCSHQPSIPIGTEDAELLGRLGNGSAALQILALSTDRAAVCALHLAPPFPKQPINPASSVSMGIVCINHPPRPP